MNFQSSKKPKNCLSEILTVGVSSIVLVMVGSSCISTFNATPRPSISPAAAASTQSMSKWQIGSISKAGTSQFTLFLNEASSNGVFTDHCNTLGITGGGSAGLVAKPCLCQFSWVEVNPNTLGGSTNRIIYTKPSQIYKTQISCPAPDAYGSEITLGTQVKVSVVADAKNPDRSTFSTVAYNDVRQNAGATSDFQDTNGNAFNNILRYSCFQKYQKVLNLASKMEPKQSSASKSDSAGSNVGNFYYSSRFCSASGAGCPNLVSDFSAQSNYFNLYIKSNQRGSIVSENNSFHCPKLRESPQDYWPLDATFALSLGPTSTFNIGVVAQSKLSADGATADACFAANAAAGGVNAGNVGGGNQGGMLTSCLGYAAQPKADGSCPSFVRAIDGVTVPTYRLRRYVALYPRSYNTTGLTANPQGIDTIYVLDRPISNAPINVPYAAMSGPKPCPFAYLDRLNVTNPSGDPIGYVGTSDPRWDEKNVDGTELPNADGLDSWGNPACSAALPLLFFDASGGANYTFQTVNLKNTTPGSRAHAYIQPIDSFLPNYVEDTSFQACAPQATPLRDPPLHFVKEPISGNSFWCAEAYPTQNPNIGKLDPPLPTASGLPTGNTSPFTSHVVKGTTSASACSATSITLPANYPVALGYARHLADTVWDGGYANGTCDRTVQQVTGDAVGAATNPHWQYPLLAPASAIESSGFGIAQNSGYQCRLNIPSGGKTSASTGCCQAGVISWTTPTAGSNLLPAAHLEPGTTCNSPRY